MDTSTLPEPLDATMTPTVQEVPEAMQSSTTRPSWWARLGRDSAYTLTALPFAVVAICLVSVLVSLGVGLLIVGIGLPILVLGLLTARGFAYLERQRLGRLTGSPSAHPDYARAGAEATVLQRLAAPVRDPQSWLDVVWVVVSTLTGTLAWTIAVVWWSCAIGGTTYGIWEQAVPRGTDPVTFASLLGFGTSERADILVISAIGVFALLTLPLALRAAALLHSTMGRDLLSGRAELQHQVRRSEAGRAAGRVAEAEALRRLERDIHDGPQQRLVRLSMDLGRAQAQLERDPELARETLDGALVQTRETVAELRSLSRGIAPPVLVDRGLEAALREAVTRSTVSTTLTYDAPASLSAHIESAVYFVVAECLTNVSKHSGATSAQVSLSVQDGEARLVIEDDGHGGAMPTPDGGLAGLAQRVRAADGLLDITSPRGGPTVIRTELPCG